MSAAGSAREITTPSAAFLTICALILANFIDVLELFQRFDDVDVLPAGVRPRSAARHSVSRGTAAPEVLHGILTTSVQAIVEHSERFEDVSPILALVVQSFVQHLDDLDKVLSMERVMILISMMFDRRCLLLRAPGLSGTVQPQSRLRPRRRHTQRAKILARWAAL